VGNSGGGGIVNAAIPTALAISGYALPVNPVALASEPGDIFTVRHILRGLDLDDEQVEVAEAAVELVRQGVYPREAA
jgi:hypothetical protein